MPYQNIIQFDGYYEDMKQYYGILIPLLAEYRKNKSIHLTPFSIDTNKKIDLTIKKYNTILEWSDKTLQEWMELVVLHTSITSNCYFNAYQITNYDWVDFNFINLQIDRILNRINTTGSFEYLCSTANLHGYFDYFDETEIWEFKCSSTLSDDYKIQCGAYVSMLYLNNKNFVPCKLFNTRTGEIPNITVTDAEKYIDILIRAKKNISIATN